MVVTLGETMTRYLGMIFCAAAMLLPGSAVLAQSGDYQIQAGDVLVVSVWKEEDLQQELIVRPDGVFSFPLVGEVVAKGNTVEQVRASVAEKIEAFIPDPVVTVTLRQSLGNRVFVLGKVNRPGEFPLTQDLDVMQALALGGGTATFADEKNISILRRSDGVQSAIPFNYKEVQYGRALEQNILLEAGDVVVVP